MFSNEVTLKKLILAVLFAISPISMALPASDYDQARYNTMLVEICSSALEAYRIYHINSKDPEVIKRIAQVSAGIHGIKAGGGALYHLGLNILSKHFPSMIVDASFVSQDVQIMKDAEKIAEFNKLHQKSSKLDQIKHIVYLALTTALKVYGHYKLAEYPMQEDHDFVDDFLKKMSNDKKMGENDDATQWKSSWLLTIGDILDAFRKANLYTAYSTHDEAEGKASFPLYGTLQKIEAAKSKPSTDKKDGESTSAKKAKPKAKPKAQPKTKQMAQPKAQSKPQPKKKTVQKKKKVKAES